MMFFCFSVIAGIDGFMMGDIDGLMMMMCYGLMTVYDGLLPFHSPSKLALGKNN